MRVITDRQKTLVMKMQLRLLQLQQECIIPPPQMYRLLAKGIVHVLSDFDFTIPAHELLHAAQNFLFKSTCDE